MLCRVACCRTSFRQADNLRAVQHSREQAVRLSECNRNVTTGAQVQCSRCLVSMDQMHAFHGFEQQSTVKPSDQAFV